MKPLRKIYILVFLFSYHTFFGQDIKLDGSWKFKIGDQRSWAKADYNDSDWRSIWVPSNWEDEGYHGYDGYAWYRKTFDGTRLKAGETYYLKLGYIDDVDEVYVNGKLVGFSGSMPPNFRTAFRAERNYLIPEGLINFKGNNLIAVRVFDVTSAGGIVDGEIGVFRYRSAASPMLIDLRGVWDFTVSKTNNPVTIANWDHLMVPGHWEEQGYRNYDGYAWYRKVFTVEADLNDDDLVLLMGKIDDFDEVYINGRLIGQTNDGRPFMSSHSYEKLRVYSIPKGLLKKNQENVVEALITDIGRDGGIYEGPIGVTSRDLYNQYYRQ